MVDDERKERKMEPENIKEILSVVSSEVPALIKSVLSSVFSEEAGRNMGKAAAAYYKELKTGGLPEPIAVKMTEDYMRTFTSIGDMLRSSGMGRHGERSGDNIREEVEKRVRERLDKKTDRDTTRESEEEEKE